MLERFEPCFLSGKLLRIPRGERALFRASLQGFQIFAKPLLVVVDFLRLVVALRNLLIQRRNAILLLDDFLEFGFDCGVDGALL